MRRRTIIKALIGAPFLALIRPRPVAAQTTDGPIYTDDLGTVDLLPVHDAVLTTGIEYQA